MTGYGRAAETVDGYDISFELRSVNNRYLDVNIRLPRIYGYLEEKLKKLIQSRVSRGKVDAFLTVERPVGEAAEIAVDEALAAQYVAALRRIAEKEGLKNDISVATVARFSDVFTRKSKEEDEDAVWLAVERVATAALDAFVAMR